MNIITTSYARQRMRLRDFCTDGTFEKLVKKALRRASLRPEDRLRLATIRHRHAFLRSWLPWTCDDSEWLLALPKSRRKKRIEHG